MPIQENTHFCSFFGDGLVWFLLNIIRLILQRGIITKIKLQGTVRVNVSNNPGLRSHQNILETELRYG